jgi:hypothetical protein
MAKLVQFVEIDTPAFPISSPMGDDVTWRFAMPTEYLPAEFDAIPSIANISYSAATVSLGEDLGQRASLTITFRDHKHVLDGEAFDSGSFWGKFRARYGQKLRGRAVRLIRGFLGQQLEDMETRHFFVESTDGPTPDGTYTIVAKDLLKFADDERAQAPRLSNGKLAGSINNSVGSATLSPTGIGDLEYPASGYVCFGGKEIVAFTRSSDTLTITRAQLGTVAIAHDAGDRAQLVLWYDGDDPADIISDLFQTYAGMPSECIPLADWQAETGANLSVLYARAITEPTAVNKLVGELIEQAALAVWWDELARVVRLQVLREIATDAATFDEEVILDGSLKVKDQPDKRISQIWSYFGQRDPTDRADNEDNFRAALATVDLAREDEYGSPIMRKILGTWVPTESAADRLNQIQISRFRDPPRRFNFDLFQGAEVAAGGGYRLRWRQNQDVTGAIVDDGAPIQVTRVAVDQGMIHVEAEEMLASGTVVVTNVIFLTDTSGLLSWTVPDDWNDADNSIHCIGGGGGGGGSNGSDGGSGGGAGAYSSVTNLDLTPTAGVSYRVGSGGAGGSGGFFAPATAGTAGGDTWFNGATLGASSVGAKAGTGGAANSGAGGTGGAAGSGIGDFKTSGGSGGQGYNQGDNAGGAGGGGAAGPNGNGAAGGGDPGVSGEDGGGGGGGANGGSAGQDSPGGAGGNGGNNRFNFGGGSEGVPAKEGGGGQGGATGGNNGQPGGVGEQLWTQTIAPIISAGPGGGAGGGGDTGGRGAAGGLYGGAGSGAGDLARGGAGAQGIIIIIYKPA